VSCLSGHVTSVGRCWCPASPPSQHARTVLQGANVHAIDGFSRETRCVASRETIRVWRGIDERRWYTHQDRVALRESYKQRVSCLIYSPTPDHVSTEKFQVRTMQDFAPFSRSLAPRRPRAVRAPSREHVITMQRLNNVQ
jgi:hypothetical protein